MNNISAFDIIGPNMVGPSSSHTAGALKISLLARKMVPGKILSVRFILYGSFARTYQGHGTDRALLGGILGYNTDDRRIKDAFFHAEKAGLDYAFEPNFTVTDVHPNTVDIIMTGENGAATKITGVSVGGGSAMIQKINDVNISLTGEYNTIFVTQQDKPGVVAHITNCLSAAKINIAFMKLFREDKGKLAYTVIESDEVIPPDVLRHIEELSYIKSALLIQL